MIGALALICIAQLISSHITDERRRKYADSLVTQWIQERKEWQVERQQLIDRIQAPTFHEYKVAEVKMEKAKRQEPEPPAQPLL
jgi:hypothetical protein